MGREAVKVDYKEPEEKEARYSDDPRDIGWVRENIPCQDACPADTNIPGYIRAVYEERYERSYEINRDANVLPGVLGRICTRPCEDSCRHGWPGNGEAVGICHTKRVGADHKLDSVPMSKHLYTSTKKHVGIVGAGPGGVAMARALSILGHDVTLYEREEKPGGMLQYGIPEFRLPREVLDTELHNAIRLGVELKTGFAIGSGEGETPVSELLKKHDAVILTTGCMTAIKLPLRDSKKDFDPVDEIENVEYGFDFLLEMHRGEKKKVGRRVAIIGAGFTALDCSRIARRLKGKEVTIHLRTSEEYIPVSKEEIAEAKREGVKIKGLRTPVGIQKDGDGKVTGVEFIQNRLGEFRDNGRRAAIPIEGSEFVEPCDTILVAIGQKNINDFLDVNVDLERWGNVKIDGNCMTSVKGLFAAGDFVNGASTVIEAIGHAQESAIKIDGWLMGKVRRKQVVRIESVEEPLRERAFDFIPKQHMPTIPVNQRFDGIKKEVETGYDHDTAIEESKRCYLCDLKYEIDIDNCIYCRACIEVAPRNCIKLVDGIEINEDGTYGELHETRKWNEVGAIWIDNDECIRCGACFDVCPTKCISITRHELVHQDVK